MRYSYRVRLSVYILGIINRPVKGAYERFQESVRFYNPMLHDDSRRCQFWVIMYISLNFNRFLSLQCCIISSKVTGKRMNREAGDDMGIPIDHRFDRHGKCPKYTTLPSKTFIVLSVSSFHTFFFWKPPECPLSSKDVVWW